MRIRVHNSVYIVYTDGACSNNPGPGGYAFIIIPPDKRELTVSGGKIETTNNRMELMAIVRALEHIYNDRKNLAIKKCTVHIYSDSAYCINPISEGWIYNWQKSGWKTKKGDPVKNLDLWQYIYEFLNKKDYLTLFHKVKGHSGNEYNERVDTLAKEAVKRICSMNKR